MKANRLLTYSAMALGASALAGPVLAADSEATYQIFFPIDSAELDAEANREIAEAADEWERSGSGQVSVIGHSDTSGAADYNLQLSEQRAGAVEDALVQEGVPANRISAEARGQEELLVPTADGVFEETNRRVEIIIPIVEQEVVEEPAEPARPPEPLPPASEPAIPQAEPAPESDSDTFTFALGPVWGKNFGENDNGAENDMVGAELTFRALPGFLGGVSVSQMGLWAFNAIDDGLTGRTVASLDFAPDFGIFRPTLAVNGGLVYGKGVQDGFVVGPELRFDVAPIADFNIGFKVAYDYQFETNDFEEGIVWTGLDLATSLLKRRWIFHLSASPALPSKIDLFRLAASNGSSQCSLGEWEKCEQHVDFTQSFTSRPTLADMSPVSSSHASDGF